LRSLCLATVLAAVSLGHGAPPAHDRPQRIETVEGFWTDL